ncbi:hypothetical protein DICA3_A10242 [Diutina catenulata]
MPKKGKSTKTTELESSVYPILEINYPDPLFCSAAHPTKPIIATGLATGHIYVFKYDADALESRAESKLGDLKGPHRSVSQTSVKWWETFDTPAPNNDDVISLWKTKRHQGACRHIVFDPLDQGASLYSVGSDHIIKKANSETGQVIGKIDVSKFYGKPATNPHKPKDENDTGPQEPPKTDAITKLLCSPSLPLVLAGTESGGLLVFDSGLKQLRYKLDFVHEDAINAILPMPAVSNYHFLTIGSTTLVHVDLRKGAVTTSDDQGDELMAIAYPSNFVNDHKNDTVLVAHGEGLVSVWKNSKNSFADQLTRIKVNKGVSIDSMISTMNGDDQGENPPVDCLWAGDSEGLVHRINYKRGRIIETRVHSFEDEVGVLDIDYDYRLVSSGMDTLKIWSTKLPEEVADIEISSDSDEGESDASDSSEGLESEDEDSSKSDIEKDSDPSDASDASDEGSDAGGSDSEPDEPAPKRQKVKGLTVKQLRNAQSHEHGIRKFDDL